MNMNNLILKVTAFGVAALAVTTPAYAISLVAAPEPEVAGGLEFFRI